MAVLYNGWHYGTLYCTIDGSIVHWTIDGSIVHCAIDDSIVHCAVLYTVQCTGLDIQTW